MKKTTCFLVIFTLILSSILFTGCSNSDKLKSPIRLTDMMDREVTIEKKVNKIVSLTPSNTEILYAIGLGDLIVGVDEYSNYPSDTANKQKVGDYTGPNLELIVSKAPDVVFASTKLQKSTIDDMVNAGIIVVAAEATSYSQIYESIELIGKVCQVTDESDKLINDMKNRAMAVYDRVKDLEKKSVYYVSSFGEYGDWTSGPGSFINDMLIMAGGAPFITINYPWIQYNVEDIIINNPEVVVSGLTDSEFDSLKQATGYKDLYAFKNGRVYNLDPDIISRPGPRSVGALEQISEFLHPKT